MYKKHKRHGKSQDFLYKISSYNLLKMQKMQFLGPDIILIRLGIGGKHYFLHVSSLLIVWFDVFSHFRQHW